jgi:hypothetical protein
MRFHLKIVAGVIFILSTMAGAHAQPWSGNYIQDGDFSSTTTLFQSSLAVNPSAQYVSVNNLTNGGAFQGPYFLPLSSFASSAQLAAMSAQVTTQMSNFTVQIAGFEKRSAELSSLAASFNIMPPNPGDRFSLTFSGAGADSTGALSISGAARISDRALVFAGVARGSTQTMAKGGASLSFH